MKKSFLITLAAVSSVALIGCSSSDDNGGNTGNSGNTTYELTSATASTKLGKNDEYVGVKVKVEGTKKVGDAEVVALTAEDTTIDASACGADVVVDEKQDHVAIKNADLASCKIIVKAGDKNQEATELDTTDSNYENLPTVTVVPANPAGGKFENGVLDVTKPKDGAAKQTYTVAANKAGTLNVNAADKTVEYKAGEAITGLTIAEKNDNKKLNDIFAKEGEGFTLDLTHASLKADITGAIIEVSKATDLTPAKEITVNITLEKDEVEPGTAQALAAPEAVADSHLSSTAAKVASITVPDGVAAGVKLVCASDATAQATVVTKDCVVKEQLYVEADKKIYFTTDESKDASNLAISEDGSNIAATKALPTAEKFQNLKADNTKVGYISATNQSATVEASALANTPVDTAIAESKIALGTDASKVTILEIKSDNAKKLYKYSVEQTNVKREAVTAPKLAVELVTVGGEEANKPAVAAGAGKNGTACAATQAAAGESASAYLCQVKLTNSGTAITDATKVNIVIKDKKDSATETVTLTGKAAS